MRTTPLAVCTLLSLSAACAGSNANDDLDDLLGGKADTVEPTAFRIESLQLRDPHTFIRIVFSCSDQTGMFDSQISDRLNQDKDGDGMLDIGLVALFKPLDPAAATSPTDVLAAKCTAPAASTSCSPDPAQEPVSSTVTNQNTGVCLQPLPGTTGGYSTAINTPGGPCFVSDSQTLTLPVGDVNLTLSDARVAAKYDAVHDKLIEGTMRGFLSETDANTVKIPDEVPLIGGKPLAFVFPGGTGNCSNRNDKDTGPNGVRGWYFYLNFTASVVPFQP